MSAPASSTAPTKTPPRDHLRETLETIVFVVVLVLILQLFVLEAFVIPTGSMAETQLGNHKNLTCKQCKYEFTVNAADEAEELARPGDERDRDRAKVSQYVCPNCQYAGKIDESIGITSGDRVLVHKAMLADERGRIVVFKYPMAPQKKQQAQNYIKRCVGFGGETIAIAYGDLYVTTALNYPHRERPDDTRALWQLQYTYSRDESALKLFQSSNATGFPAGAGGFELYRKPDELAMEMRRIVYDNDFQPADLIGQAPARWAPRTGEEAGWQADNPKSPKVFKHTGTDLGWVGYRHLSEVRSNSDRPQEIHNTMAYNCNKSSGPGENYRVGDLMLECTAEMDAGSELTMELSKGEHRYQAMFSDGKVTLVRTGPGNWTPVSRPLPSQKAGPMDLRFANIDCRLRVWVNNTAIDFGNEADYPPSMSDQKTVEKNDVEAPAGIAAKGTVSVSHLRLWRDTYYTPASSDRDTIETYYIHPGHYLCLGDNSAQSSDGRSWGVVPERLMIGRAVFTFWPAYPKMRIGVIR